MCVCYVLGCTPCQQKTGGVLPSWWCVPLLTPLPAGPCRAAPTVGTMILKGGGVGRGWSQFSLISQSSLGSRKSRSLGVSSLSVSVPQCGRVCPTVGWCTIVVGCPSVGGCLQCGRVCPSVGGVSQCGRVPQCRRVSPVWEGVPQCGRCVPVWEVCPSVGGCVSVWEGLSVQV